MRIGIVGSRERYFKKYPNAVQAFEDKLDLLLCDKSDVTIVSGASPEGGIDIWAASYANKRKYPLVEHPPTKKTTEAYHARNKEIVADSDEIWAFIQGGILTAGTAHTVSEAITAKKHVRIYSLDGEMFLPIS